MDTGIMTALITGAALVGSAIGWCFRQYWQNREFKKQAADGARETLSQKKEHLEEMITKTEDTNRKQTLHDKLDEVNAALLELLDQRIQQTLKDANLPPENTLISKGLSDLQSHTDLNISMNKLRLSVEQAIQAMSLIQGFRDPYTAGHERRVAQLSYAIGKEMGLPTNQLEGLRMAAFIHDIGKIIVPSEILKKPGALTDPEFSLIKAHSQVGYDILKTIEFPWPVAQIVMQHHEKLDGSSYPLGLTGEKILLEAKILAVADLVEALSSYHPYHPTLSIDQLLDEITRNSGKLYDPTVVDACVRLFTEKSFRFD